MKLRDVLLTAVDRMTVENWTTGDVFDGNGCRCALGHMAEIIGLPMQTVEDEVGVYNFFDEIDVSLGAMIYRVNDDSRGHKMDKAKRLELVKADLRELAKDPVFDAEVPAVAPEPFDFDGEFDRIAAENADTIEYLAR